MQIFSSGPLICRFKCRASCISLPGSGSDPVFLFLPLLQCGSKHFARFAIQEGTIQTQQIFCRISSLGLLTAGFAFSICTFALIISQMRSLRLLTLDAQSHFTKTAEKSFHQPHFSVMGRMCGFVAIYICMWLILLLADTRHSSYKGLYCINVRWDWDRNALAFLLSNDTEEGAQNENSWFLFTCLWCVPVFISIFTSLLLPVWWIVEQPAVRTSRKRDKRSASFF